jgi:hypothetical protein
MAEKAQAAPVANKERGEFALILDGASFVLRPSYEAIVAFEAETGKGLIDLARTFMTGNASLQEVATVACHCIRAWGAEKNDTGAQGAQVDKVGRLILDSPAGLQGATLELGPLLILASTGGVNSKGEVKAATTTSPATSQTTD